MTGDTLQTLALASLAAYGLVTLGGRSMLARLQQRDSGWRGISGAPGSVSWWAGVTMAIAALGLPTALWLSPPAPLVSAPRVWAGGVLFALGFAGTLYAQLAMGSSWRIGVRDGEQTRLRTDGPFRWCRNPVFTGMLVSTGALVLWEPWVALPWALLWFSLELQVRVVEEPYLARTHGAAYRTYAARTGRFLPGLGRSLGRHAVGERHAAGPGTLDTQATTPITTQS